MADRRPELARGGDRRRHAEHPEEHHRRAHLAPTEGLTLATFDERLRQAVAANLARFEPRAATGDELAHAAVAATLVGDSQGRACFLITRRSSRLRDHPGQWALPGGRVDPGETAEETARRELLEELGLGLPAASVLGRLDDYATRSGFAITPIVVWGGVTPALFPNPAEVEHAYVVPVSDLDRPEIPQLRSIPESDRPVISLPIPMLNASIHAPTAAVLFQLREVAIHGRATRVAHYEQPVFAWK
ncbi:MAG TPA: CoA pyrophosphatase [Myxococcota bacterium]|nr:CoA pyrophosphatase [Myxococcota bacterium]